MLISFFLVFSWVSTDTIHFPNATRVFVGPSTLVVGNSTSLAVYASNTRVFSHPTFIVSCALSKNEITLAWMYDSAKTNSVFVADIVETSLVYRTAVPLFEEPRCVALDQTGRYMATSTTTGIIVVAYWNTSWHNRSVFSPPTDTTLHGLHLAIVSIGDTVYVTTSFYDRETVVIQYNTSSSHYTTLYTTPKSISLDATATSTWLVAIGSYETTEGGVENAGRVVVKGSHEAVLYGTDAALFFGRSVSITPTHLAVASAGPVYTTLVYAYDGTKYTSHQYISHVSTIAVSIATRLAVATSDNVTVFVENTASPTHAPTRLPTTTSITNDPLDALTLFVFALVCVLGISLFVVIFCHTVRLAQKEKSAS